jgi:transcriptional regulator with XRE-family HTH domain
MDDKTIQAALRDIRKAVKALRNAAGLTQEELSEKIDHLVHNTQISRIETGVRNPSIGELRAIFKYFGEDVVTFLAKLGLSEEEYETNRGRTDLHQDMLTGLREARTVKEINGWLVEEVVKPRPPKHQALPDLNKLHGNLSKQFTSARAAALTLPAHPFPRNASVIQPDDDSHQSLQLFFLQWLTRAYFYAGPRLTGAKAVTQKLWPLDIWENMLRPIINSGDEKKALLAASILKNYEETDTAFHEQMKGKQWQYLDIVLLSAIREFVATGKLSPDSSLKYVGITGLCPGMVRHLLFSVMGLLHQYKDTYHLALVDDVNDPTDGAVQLLAQQLTEHFFTVMPAADGQLSLIVTEWPVGASGQQWKVHRHIDDMNIVKPFMEPFCELWRKIPPHTLVTERDEVIKRIVAELEHLPTSYPK